MNQPPSHGFRGKRIAVTDTVTDQATHSMTRAASAVKPDLADGRSVVPTRHVESRLPTSHTPSHGNPYTPSYSTAPEYSRMTLHGAANDIVYDTSDGAANDIVYDASDSVENDIVYGTSDGAAQTPLATLTHTSLPTPAHISLPTHLPTHKPVAPMPAPASMLAPVPAPEPASAHAPVPAPAHAPVPAPAHAPAHAPVPASAHTPVSASVHALMPVPASAPTPALSTRFTRPEKGPVRDLFRAARVPIANTPSTGIPAALPTPVSDSSASASWTPTMASVNDHVLAHHNAPESFARPLHFSCTKPCATAFVGAVVGASLLLGFAIGIIVDVAP